MARNADTGVRHRTATNEQGFYAFPDLAIGHYSLEVGQTGFRPYAQTGLEVISNAALRVDITLTLGEHSEALTVSDAPAQVETANTQMGERISATKMSAIPVNGRSFTDLLALQTGVIPASSQQPNAVVMSGCTHAPPSGDLNPGNLSVSGQRETTNGFTVNGNSAQDEFNMGAAIVPNLDSIQEFHVLTSNFNAEYGNFSGGQVQVTTKSGTNEIHGSVFEFLRDTRLDARNYFATERATYDRNQFGGVLGGPIRKNKMFFFADYQGSRMTQGVETGIISVPSLRNRNGDFSDIASTLSGTVNGQYWADLLSRKLGHTVTAGEPYYRPGCTAAEVCVLPNARIPESAWSAPSKALLAYVPKPNQGDHNFSTSSNNQALRDDKGALRIDGNTRWGAFSAYYFSDDYRLDNPFPTGQGGANVPGFNAISEGRAQLASVSLTSTFGTAAINELRLGYMRTANDVGRPVGGVGPTLVSQGFVDGAGKPGIVALAPKIEGIENVSFNDFTMGVDITGVAQANNTYQWSDDYSRVAGKHLLKFGAAVHLDQVNINPNAMYNGSFLFQGTETGSDFADFLLGIASSYAQGDSRRFYLRNQYAGTLAQDSWQVRPSLTLNYGLRWDLLPPWREKYNQLQTLVRGQQSVVYPGAPRGLVFPGDPGIPDTLAPARHTNFAPRIGLAYAPNTKTSVRAAYGLFFTAIEGLSAGIMSANPPYGYDYDSFAPPLFATPFIYGRERPECGAAFSGADSGIRALRREIRIRRWTGHSTCRSPACRRSFISNVTPYSESYTLSIEREVARDTVLRASYIGTQAHHLLVLIAANPGESGAVPEPEPSGKRDPRHSDVRTIRRERRRIRPRSGQLIQGTRGPFDSNFAAVTNQKTIGNSNYNALEASVHHSSSSLELLLGYTYGKSLDQSSSLSEAVNPLNPRLSKALSAFDMRHNFVASYDWKLPLGRVRGRRGEWLRDWSLSGMRESARACLSHSTTTTIRRCSERFRTGSTITAWTHRTTLRAGWQSTRTRATGARRSIRRCSVCRIRATPARPRGDSLPGREWRISMRSYISVCG